MTNEEQIYQAAIDEGLTPALGNLMVAQSKFESDNYTNTATVQYNNPFGYKYIGQSITDANGNNMVSQGNTSSEGDHYAAYTSVYWAAVEIARWIKRNVANYNSITTPAQYATAIKYSKIGAFFGGALSDYIAGMQKYFSGAMQSIKNYVKNNPVKTGLVVTAVLGMMAYYIWIVRKGQKK